LEESQLIDEANAATPNCLLLKTSALISNIQVRLYRVVAAFFTPAMHRRTGPGFTVKTRREHEKHVPKSCVMPFKSIQ
jgi:hypothetical protein